MKTETKRKLIAGGGAFLAAAVILILIAFFLFQGASYTLYIEKEQIQQAIDQQMPYEKEFAFLFLLTVENTRVQLTEGSNRIGASTDFALKANLGNNPENLDGLVKMETGLRYDRDDYCFYLVEPEIRELKIRGVREKYTKAVASNSKKILRRYITDVPVYKIKDRNLKLRLARAVLKNVEVVNGKLAVTLGH